MSICVLGPFSLWNSCPFTLRRGSDVTAAVLLSASLVPLDWLSCLVVPMSCGCVQFYAKSRRTDMMIVFYDLELRNVKTYICIHLGMTKKVHSGFLLCCCLCHPLLLSLVQICGWSSDGQQTLTVSPGISSKSVICLCSHH